MKKLLVTADSIKLVDGDETTTVKIVDNASQMKNRGTRKDETPAKNKWILQTPDGKRKTFLHGGMNPLYKMVTAWLEDPEVEVTRDFTATMSENQWNDERESKFKYSGKHGYMPIFVPSGRIALVGEGVWLTRCSECSLSMTHYGVMQRYATTGPHEVEVHDAQVGGLNVGLLPR